MPCQRISGSHAVVYQLSHGLSADVVKSPRLWPNWQQLAHRTDWSQVVSRVRFFVVQLMRDPYWPRHILPAPEQPRFWRQLNVQKGIIHLPQILAGGECGSLSSPCASSRWHILTHLLNCTFLKRVGRLLSPLPKQSSSFPVSSGKPSVIVES